MRGGAMTRVLLRATTTAAICLLACLPEFSWPVFVEPESLRPDHASPRPPERPRRRVERADSRRSGRTIAVAAGGNLQRAFDEANAGDTIALDPGATYEGPFRLPQKDGSEWIVVTANWSRASLPSAGQRISPSSAARMPKLVASSGSVVVANSAAHHYRFVGIEISPARGVFLRDLVQLGVNETEIGSVPHHIVFDRCYLHGDPKKGARRGIAMNSADTAVVDSYLSDFKEAGADSQAIAGWNGPGPFEISNNFLEAAGENVMFGGADPLIPGLVPADIEIRGNHLSKPLRWKSPGEGSWEGQWTVKNLFELKNARRVLVEGNVFEYNWPQAQNGFAILFTVRNQDGGAPWSVVEDVTFSGNIVQHVGAGLNVLGQDDIHSSERTERISIVNNLFVDVGGQWGVGRLFQLLDGTSDVNIDHNTALQTDATIWGGDRRPHTRFVFENNIALHNRYGIIGSGTASGRATLDRYFPGASVRRNVIVGGTPDRYPSDNFFPHSLELVGFAGLQNGDYRLAASSAFRRAATDGGQVGADIDAINRGANRSRNATAP
jgi:hypothetical protein